MHAFRGRARLVSGQGPSVLGGTAAARRCDTWPWRCCARGRALRRGVARAAAPGPSSLPSPHPQLGATAAPGRFEGCGGRDWAWGARPGWPWLGLAGACLGRVSLGRSRGPGDAPWRACVAAEILALRSLRGGQRPDFEGSSAVGRVFCAGGTRGRTRGVHARGVGVAYAASAQAAGHVGCAGLPRRPGARRCTHTFPRPLWDGATYMPRA